MKSKRIFLSHTASDKEFARRLAYDLQENGVQVWIDEAEIKVGDSLIQKIANGLESTDYVAVILSPDSVASSWVQKELAIAMNYEIRESNVKVLPLLYRNCAVPGFLFDKLYADFRKSDNYYNALKLVLNRLGLHEMKPLSKSEPVALSIRPEVESSINPMKTIIGHMPGVWWLGLMALTGIVLLYRQGMSSTHVCLLTALLLAGGLIHMWYRRPRLTPSDEIAFWLGFTGLFAGFLSALFDVAEITILNWERCAFGLLLGAFVGLAAGFRRARAAAQRGSTYTKLGFIASVSGMTGAITAAMAYEIYIPGGVDEEGIVRTALQVGLVCGIIIGLIAVWRSPTKARVAL